MASLEENLKNVRDFLKRNKAADGNGINGFFFSVGVINHTLSMEDSKSIPAVGALLAESLAYANDFIPLLAEKVNTAIRAQQLNDLRWIASKIEEVWKGMGAAMARIDQFEKTNISTGDSKTKLDTLMASLSAIHKAVSAVLSRTEAEMKESEKESREEEEKAHLKYEYVYGWFLFTDEKEKKRCENKGVVPTKKQLEKYKTLFVAGGRTRKDVEFIRPQLDAPPVERARMAGVKFVGLAVQLLPATGAVEPTLEFITSDSRRKWRWAFLEYGKQLPERTIQGRVVSRRMLERLRIFDPARTTGQELNESFKGHISIGVKNASIPFYSFDGQREAPIGSINLTSDGKGFFKLTFKEGALPIIVHAQKEGGTSRHTDRPWGRGGNQNDPRDSLPAAPIVMAQDMFVAVALDVEPDFSDEMINKLKTLAERTKEYRKNFIGVSSDLHADPPETKKRILESIIHEGPKTAKGLQEAFVGVQRIVESEDIVGRFFISEMEKKGVASGLSIPAVMQLLLQGEQMKAIIHEFFEREGQKFGFDREKGRFEHVRSQALMVDRAVDKIVEKYYPPLEKLYKYLEAYISLFGELNPALKKVIKIG